MKITLKLNILIIYNIKSERSTKEKLMVDIFVLLVRSIYNFFFVRQCLFCYMDLNYIFKLACEMNVCHMPFLKNCDQKNF